MFWCKHAAYTVQSEHFTQTGCSILHLWSPITLSSSFLQAHILPHHSAHQLLLRLNSLPNKGLTCQKLWLSKCLQHPSFTVSTLTNVIQKPIYQQLWHSIFLHNLGLSYLPFCVWVLMSLQYPRWLADGSKTHFCFGWKCFVLQHQTQFSRICLQQIIFNMCHLFLYWSKSSRFCLFWTYNNNEWS